MTGSHNKTMIGSHDTTKMDHIRHQDRITWYNYDGVTWFKYRICSIKFWRQKWWIWWILVDLSVLFWSIQIVHRSKNFLSIFFRQNRCEIRTILAIWYGWLTCYNNYGITWHNHDRTRWYNQWWDHMIQSWQD